MYPVAFPHRWTERTFLQPIDVPPLLTSLECDTCLCCRVHDSTMVCDTHFPFIFRHLTAVLVVLVLVVLVLVVLVVLLLVVLVLVLVVSVSSVSVGSVILIISINNNLIYFNPNLFIY
jgi:hypothetical protein